LSNRAPPIVKAPLVVTFPKLVDRAKGTKLRMTP
jgi:hypothetical protein